MKKELIENHQRFLDRVELYRKLGYDIDKERSFIIEKACPFSGNILEAGTGKGFFSLALALAGFNFFSFDISAAEQRYALLNLMYHGLEQQVSFGLADIESLPCDDGFFDVIFAVNMIHHLSSVHNACNEFVRILSPRGKIVLSDFNAYGFEIVAKVHALEGRQHELSSGTMAEAKAILIEYGLEVEEHLGETQDVLIAERRLM